MHAGQDLDQVLFDYDKAVNEDLADPGNTVQLQGDADNPRDEDMGPEGEDEDHEDQGPSLPSLFDLRLALLLYKTVTHF